MLWTDIDGWFNPADAAIYTHWAQVCPPDATFVEIGTFRGRSAFYLLAKLERLGKTAVKVFCVDLFEDARLMVDAARNLERFQGRVQLARMDGHKVAELFGDRSVFGVFIDADHQYDTTLSMIHAWAPKVRLDGFMGGHDYTSDWPGVRNAVQTAFNRDPQCYGASWEFPGDSPGLGQPTISIVMPTYNTKPQYLQECWRSILAQTLPTWELVIGDGGSTDQGTNALLREMASDLRAKLLITPGSPIAASLNECLMAVRCDVVANMDSDDVMLPTRLGTQLDYLQSHPEVDLVGSQIDYIGKVGQTAHPRVITKELASKSNWFMNHPTIMYRKEAVLGVGGYPPGVDFDLMLRLVQANCTLHNLASVLVHYRVYPESTTFHADVGTYVREVREKVAANSTGAAFINIYRKKIWGSACLSGDGSTDKAVEGLLEPLSILINGHDISRVLDVGCGISPWFERVLPDDLGVYLGVDVVPAVIQTRTTLRTHPKCEYRLLDMSQLAPSAKFDLAISRDVLTHLPDDLVLKVLANIKSCSRWLLTTQWPETDRNTNIQVGGWRAINLCLPPFNLPAPTATFQEVDKGKFLALFDLEGWKG